jgi:hypothetical protein
MMARPYPFNFPSPPNRDRLGSLGNIPDPNYSRATGQERQVVFRSWRKQETGFFSGLSRKNLPC